MKLDLLIAGAVSKEKEPLTTYNGNEDTKLIQENSKKKFQQENDFKSEVQLGEILDDFLKEIGTQGTQGLSQVVTPDNSDLKMSMLSKLFNTTTTTLSNLIKKDKAFLKYNYIVFLKDNKTTTNE